MAKKTDKTVSWRREKAVRLLAGTVLTSRSDDTISGKVDACFDEIVAARRRGMGWKQIAAALDAEAGLKDTTVGGAFKRLCVERGIAAPGRSGMAKAMPAKATTPAKPEATERSEYSGMEKSVLEQNEDLFDPDSRWVDDGHD